MCEARRPCTCGAERNRKETSATNSRYERDVRSASYHKTTTRAAIAHEPLRGCDAKETCTRVTVASRSGAPEIADCLASASRRPTRRHTHTRPEAARARRDKGPPCARVCSAARVSVAITFTYAHAVRLPHAYKRKNQPETRPSRAPSNTDACCNETRCQPSRSPNHTPRRLDTRATTSPARRAVRTPRRAVAAETILGNSPLDRLASTRPPQATQLYAVAQLVRKPRRRRDRADP